MAIRSCPRCHQDFDDRYPARSRSTDGRDIDICGPCGSDEAYIELNGNAVQLMSTWPVQRQYDGP